MYGDNIYPGMKEVFCFNLNFVVVTLSEIKSCLSGGKAQVIYYHQKPLL